MTKKEEIQDGINIIENKIENKESELDGLKDEISLLERDIENLEEEKARLEEQLEDAEPDILGNLYMYICTNQPLYLQFIKEELGEHEVLDDENQTVVDVHNIPLSVTT